MVPCAWSGSQDLGHDIPDKAVGLGGVKEENPVKAGGRELLANQHDQGIGHRLFAQIALAENAEDVFDPRPGRFPKKVLFPKPLKVFFG